MFSFGLAHGSRPTATVLGTSSESTPGSRRRSTTIARTAGLIAVAAVGAVVASVYGKQLDANLGNRLPPSANQAVAMAKRQTFGTIDAKALPPSDRAFAKQAAASASESAFHLAMGIGWVLLVIAGIGGLAIKTKRRTDVHCADCRAGQFAGQPKAVLQGLEAHQAHDAAPVVTFSGQQVRVLRMAVDEANHERAQRPTASPRARASSSANRTSREPSPRPPYDGSTSVWRSVITSSWAR